MPLNYTEIIQKIDEHLNKSGKNYYNEFYIGQYFGKFLPKD